jgi:catechol 2,3-dioxygenase-like lactoylglutathione lyase family enzyme
MAVRGLYLVQLTVTDWPASLAWYRDRLGLAVVLVDERNGFGLLQAGPVRLALKAGTPEPGTVRLTFEVDGLDAELDRLAARGILPEQPVQASPEGYRQALLRDPDGYQLCLFEWA